MTRETAPAPTLKPTVGVSSTFPKGMPADHARLPVWNAENWFYEDFEVGHKIREADPDSEQFRGGWRVIHLLLDISISQQKPPHEKSKKPGRNLD